MIASSATPVTASSPVASPWLWPLSIVAWIGWFVAANAFDFQAYCFRHAPHALDVARGYTHMMDNHGDVRFIRQIDFAQSTAWEIAGAAVMAAAVIVMLVVLKPDQVRHAMIRRGGVVIPVLLFVAVNVYWSLKA